jgi:hypothetical protein
MLTPDGGVIDHKEIEKSPEKSKEHGRGDDLLDLTNGDTPEQHVSRSLEEDNAATPGLLNGDILSPKKPVVTSSTDEITKDLLLLDFGPSSPPPATDRSNSLNQKDNSEVLLCNGSPARNILTLSVGSSMRSGSVTSIVSNDGKGNNSPHESSDTENPSTQNTGPQESLISLSCNDCPSLLDLDVPAPRKPRALNDLVLWDDPRGPSLVEDLVGLDFQVPSSEPGRDEAPLSKTSIRVDLTIPQEEPKISESVVVTDCNSDNPEPNVTKPTIDPGAMDRAFRVFSEGIGLFRRNKIA